MYNVIPPVNVHPETFLLLSPELTEQTACLEERVESRAGAVFYARPTQGAETITFEIQTSCQPCHMMLLR